MGHFVLKGELKKGTKEMMRTRSREVAAGDYDNNDKTTIAIERWAGICMRKVEGCYIVSISVYIYI